MKILRLFLFLLGVAGAAHAQSALAPTPAAPKASGAMTAPAKPKPKIKRESVEVLLARARQLKSQGKLDDARRTIYKIYDAADEDENFVEDPRAAYTLGWIDIAQRKRTAAITEFRSALASGLKGRDAAEARAALKRMGVSEKFPRYKPRPRSVISMIRSQAMMADLFKPTASEWALQTAITLAVVAVLWAIVLGAQLLGGGRARHETGSDHARGLADAAASVARERPVSHVVPLCVAFLARLFRADGRAVFGGVFLWRAASDDEKGDGQRRHPLVGRLLHTAVYGFRGRIGGAGQLCLGSDGRLHRVLDGEQRRISGVLSRGPNQKQGRPSRRDRLFGARARLETAQ